MDQFWRLFLRKLGDYSIGIEYDYNSTGSRISSADYSGKYTFDELLHGHSFGLVNSFRFLRLGKVQAEAGVNLGYIYSSIKTNEYLQVADTNMSNSSSFYSDSFYLEPGMLISYTFPFMKIGADLSYLIDKGGVIMTDSDKKTLNYTNWSGFRIGINVGLFPEALLSKKKREK